MTPPPTHSGRRKRAFVFPRPSLFLSLGKNCTMSRYEVRKVFHSQWRETREREEESLTGVDCQPVIPSIHGSLSSSLRSTFVVQLTTMLLHNNSRHARHPVPHFVATLSFPLCFSRAYRNFLSDHNLSHFNDLYPRPIQKNK